jgi:hypothetical protein
MVQLVACIGSPLQVFPLEICSRAAATSSKGEVFVLFDLFASWHTACSPVTGLRFLEKFAVLRHRLGRVVS